MSYLVANPEDRFSHDVAQIKQWIETRVTPRLLHNSFSLTKDNQDVTKNKLCCFDINVKSLNIQTKSACLYL